MQPRSWRTGMHRAARPILLLPFNMLQATDQAPAPKWIVLGSDAWGIIQTALTDISAIETQRMLRSPQLDRLRVKLSVHSTFLILLTV